MKFLYSAELLTLVQLLVVVLACAGLFYFPITPAGIAVSLVFYFLYSGIGVSMMMHRYWSHRSFEFKWPMLKWLCTWFALMSCRGSILGWVYTHRLHHKYADTDKDPHAPAFKGWRIFFPYFMKYDENINKFIIRDFLNPVQLHLSKYFMLYLLLWVVIFGIVGSWFLYFAWILPVAVTQLVVSSFLYFGHTRDKDINTSKNSMLFSLLFWGEGWHNDHHANPGKYFFGNKRWQFDLIGHIIGFIKK